MPRRLSASEHCATLSLALLGMAEGEVIAHRAAQRVKETERLRRATLRAETLRILRNGRPYSAATDPIKMRIRERQGRLLATPAGSKPTEGHKSRDFQPDYLRELEAIVIETAAPGKVKSAHGI